MADITGQWGTISFGIPDFLEAARDAVNDFAELLISFLEIANLALEFIKGFVKAFLDPLVAIIEAIINEIVAFLRDLKQIGLYITGDWALLGWPPEDLRGGFQGYERRMIARLADRTDPTRPDVSSATQVLALFAYISVDPTDFERLVNFIISMMRLFGLSYFPDTSRLPIPVIQHIQYGSQAIGGAISSFQFSTLGKALGSWGGSPPQNFRVTWTTSPASQKHPLNPFPMLGPSGYLVTISTIPDGISLKYARPRANTDKKAADGDKNKQAQPREYGNVLDANGQAVKLYGGAEMLSFKGSEFEYNKAIDVAKGIPKDGYCQVFGSPDPASNEVITLEDLGPTSSTLGTPGDGKGKDYFLQRTFLITDGVTLAQWFAGEYSTVFGVDDLPHHARWEKSSGLFRPVDEGVASTYYVRVWSVGKQVADGTVIPQWNFKATEFKTNVWKSGQPFVIDLKSGSASIGNPSEPRKVTVVGANTQEYLRALETALLVLVLTRSDLPTLAEIEETKGADTAANYRAGKYPALGFVTNATGLEGDANKLLLKRMFPNPEDLEKPDQNPLKWRSDLYHQVKKVAQELYDKSGPNVHVEKAVVEGSVDLRAFTIGEALGAVEGGFGSTWEAFLRSQGLDDPKLLDAFDPDNPVSQSLQFGFAPNPMSAGMKSTDVDDLFFLPQALQGRDQDFVLFDSTPVEPVEEEPDPLEFIRIIESIPESLRRIYEKFVNEDGSFSLPDEWRAMLQGRTSKTRRTSSGDSTPVFVVAQDVLVGLNRYSTYYETFSDAPNVAGKPYPGMVFTRGLLREARVQEAGGQALSPILTQAAFVLQVAGVEKPPADGEWIALRLFDTWPELEEFLRALENWVKSLAEAIRSMADAIIRYIEFLQAQIVELQQLIRRINALIQSFLSFSFALPQFSGLMLLSNGTDGVLADLVSATNKPSDSPLSYGGGVAIVVPFAPSFIFDIIALTEGGQDLNASTQVTRPPDAIGTEAVEPTPGAPPTDEPDVL